MMKNRSEITDRVIQILENKKCYRNKEGHLTSCVSFICTATQDIPTQSKVQS